MAAPIAYYARYLPVGSENGGDTPGGRRPQKKSDGVGHEPDTPSRTVMSTTRCVIYTPQQHQR